MDEITADKLMILLKEHFWYEVTNMHTSFPGVVESYDPATRRADIQPSLTRKMPDGAFLAWPVIPNVPVRFPGTKKYTIHFPLEKGDEVEVTVCERSTGKWRASGGKDIEDGDLRRFDLNDCYCSPGLQPVEFIAVEEAGLNIVHKTGFDGDLISSVTMDDDKIEVLYKDETKDSFSFLATKDKVETVHKKDDQDVFYHAIEKDRIESVYKKDDTQIAKTTINDAKIETLYKDISSAVMEDADITVKYKEKCQVKMEDDHLTAKTEKCTAEMAADVLTAKNSQLAMKLNGSKASLKNGTKSLYTIWHTFLSTLKTTKPATMGSPGQHNWNPLIETAIGTADSDLGALLEA
jgi:hypothetical protein